MSKNTFPFNRPRELRDTTGTFMHFLAFPDVMVKAETSQLSLITTNPVLPNNEIAYGFRGLQFITQVPQSNLYRSCSWNYPNRGFIDLFRDFLPCENRFALTCVNVSNVVHTTYTNEDPIINGNTVSLSCNSNNTRVSNAFTYRVKSKL